MKSEGSEKGVEEQPVQIGGKKGQCREQIRTSGGGRDER
jgi:hypothetical protein